MNRDDAKAEIKRLIPCTRYLKKAQRGGYICPYCGSGEGTHKTGAVKYYPDTNSFYCHACGKGGDVIDLAQKDTGADYNTAFSLLAQEANITVDENTRPEAVKRSYSDFNESDRETTADTANKPAEAKESAAGAGTDYTAYYRQCAARITDPAATAYLQQRGISQETAAAYNLGYDPQADPANAPGGIGESKHPAARIIIPSTAAHYMGRAIDPATPKEWQKMNVKGSTPGIFNAAVLYAQEVQEVFVTEGAFTALSVIEAGAAAIALNSAVNVEKLLAQLEARPTAATLVLCFDNDPDEKTRAQIEKDKTKLEQGLQAMGSRYIEADICGSYNDANDYLQADRTGFIKSVQEATEAARAAAADTGASVIDSFLSAIYTEKYKPIPTGVKGLDKLLHGGLIPQTLVLLGSEPGAGKTALTTMIFENMARAGQPGIYFNLEMSAEQLIARSLSRIAYLNNNWKMDALDVLQGYRQDADTRGVVENAAQIYKDTIEANLQYNPGNTGADVTQILDYIDKTGKAAQEAGRPAPHIAIDYLQLLQGNGKEDAAEVIKRAIKGLKDYAVKYNAIVFCIMAQSRAVNNRNEATLSAGRDTSGLEYTADLQLQLVRENEDDQNEITLFVTKSRFTQSNMKDGKRFKFHGAQSYFEELDGWTQARGNIPFEAEKKRY